MSDARPTSTDPDTAVVPTRRRHRRRRLRRQPPRGHAARAGRHRRRASTASRRTTTPTRSGRTSSRARDHDAFTLVEADLREADLMPVLEGVDIVFHQAAQPGVRLSWSDGFGEYASHNVLATQRLLEAARDSDVRRVVYASSSSVYGNQDRYPTVETDLPRPYSPYGVTKLAAEHLCGLYAENWGLHTVVAALLHRLRTAAAPRHVDPPAVRGRAHRRVVPALRRRRAGPRVHLRRRHRRREPLRRRRRRRTRAPS